VLFAQENPTFKLTSSSGEVYLTNKFRTSNERVDFVDVNGVTMSIKNADILSMREVIPNWRYFEFGKKEFTDFVAVDVDSLSSEELFKTSINWIKETYKNPDKVIKTTIDNSKIRFEGFKENAIRMRILGMTYYYGGTYTIEISFKDGKYKFDPISLTYYTPPSQYAAGGDSSVTLGSTAGLFNEKGEIIKAWRYLPVDVEDLFNDLNISLFKYIKSSKTTNNNDW
jgi:hypothetical protein